MSLLIAVDPGKDKCGLVLSDPDEGYVLEGMNVISSKVVDQIITWKAKITLQGIVLGNGTTSSDWYKLLSQIAPVIVVKEEGSTLRARERYWELWPPVAWLTWMPRGLMVPTHDLDVIAALVLLEDHLQKKLLWVGPAPFRNDF